MLAPLGGSLSNLINEQLNAFQPPFLHGRANKQDTPNATTITKKCHVTFPPFYSGTGCAELPLSIIRACTDVIFVVAGKVCLSSVNSKFIVFGESKGG